MVGYNLTSIIKTGKRELKSVRTTRLPEIAIMVLTISVLFPVLHVYADSDCKERNQGMATMHLEEISLLDGKGRIVKIDSFIADNEVERASGYQFICPDIVDNTTILFVYPQSVSARFHMRNVRSPLDIGFFDQQGILIESMLMDTYDDGNSRLYHPSQPFQYALEARPGYFVSNNFKDGITRLVVGSLYDNK